MIPSQGQGNEPGSLEDRLRGLILNNANPNQNITPVVQPPPQPSSQLPPHMRGANIQDQAAYLALTAARSQGPPPGPPHEFPAKQRRPNQAQRRQMNSGMSIPIDTRPNHPAQAGRSPGFGGNQSPHYNQPYQNRNPNTSHAQQFSPRHQNPQQSPQLQNHPHSAPLHHSFPSNSHQPHQSGFRPNNSRQGPNSPQLQHGRPSPQNRQLYQPGVQGRGRSFGSDPQEIPMQVQYLENLLQERVPQVGVEAEEEATKEEFRASIEKICQEAIAEFEKENSKEIFDVSSVQLECFGSMKSGFATKASDMDLALLAPKCIPAPDSAESRIPRLLEKKLLDLGYGARLLTRTRVPIIKLCQKPTEKLLADLLEERTKWDNGVTDDDEHVDHDFEKPKHLSVDHSASPIDTQHPVELASPVDAQPPDIPPTSGPETLHSPMTPLTPGPFMISKDDYHAKLSQFKQGTQQSLNDYFNSAKRLLRRLGGRDVTANSPEFTDRENQILDDVCKAYIVGLSSKECSNRLQQYKSIQKLFNPPDGNRQRTLQGIHTQVDGERFVMAWDLRPFTESNETFESEAFSAIESWIALQDKTSSILDPAFYSRQLFAALDKLKKVNSLQIMLLEQLPHEEPALYSARTRRILKTSFRPRGAQTTQEDISRLVVEKYIAGILNPAIRDAMEVGTLQGVTREHMRMQLAIDYERALDLKIFDEGDINDVKQYIYLLKTKNFTIHSALITKMRNLPDPTQVSVLKPRDPYKDKLEFPKTDIGIQCDINFSAHLAIHNTLLLRCYAASDSRVRPMILFVKHWAKVRGINTPYRGTLSSYGYVLMVLHYLVHVSQPFVCPNLQRTNKDPPAHLSPAEIEAQTTCAGRDVRFWRNEAVIKDLADRGLLNHNKDLLGFLLRGFFEYYAQMGFLTTVNVKGFDWGREVLSLRNAGGLLTKQEKGWTGAKTTIETSIIAAPPTPNEANDSKVVKTMEETKEIRHRYLFAIEDPFELDHNVARTVTHNGIVSIRDEFRRAWKIIREVGKGGEEGLLDPHIEAERKNGLKEAMDIIHGVV